jgi:hypothetical protein
MAIGAMAMAGFGFWSYNQDTLHKTQLEGAQKEITRLNLILYPPEEEIPPTAPQVPQTPNRPAIPPQTPNRQ